MAAMARRAMSTGGKHGGGGLSGTDFHERERAAEKAWVDKVRALSFFHESERE